MESPETCDAYSIRGRTRPVSVPSIWQGKIIIRDATKRLTSKKLIYWQSRYEISNSECVLRKGQGGLLLKKTAVCCRKTGDSYLEVGVVVLDREHGFWRH